MLILTAGPLPPHIKEVLIEHQLCAGPGDRGLGIRIVNQTAPLLREASMGGVDKECILVSREESVGNLGVLVCVCVLKEGWCSWPMTGRLL